MHIHRAEVQRKVPCFHPRLPGITQNRVAHFENSQAGLCDQPHFIVMKFAPSNKRSHHVRLNPPQDNPVGCQDLDMVETLESQLALQLFMHNHERDDF